MNSWAIVALVFGGVEIARLIWELRKKSAQLEDFTAKIADFHENLVKIETSQQTRYMAMLEQQTTQLGHSFEAVTRTALASIVETREKLYPEPEPSQVGYGDVRSEIEDELAMIRQVESDPRAMEQIVNSYMERIGAQAGLDEPGTGG